MGVFSSPKFYFSSFHYYRLVYLWPEVTQKIFFQSVIQGRSWLIILQTRFSKGVSVSRPNKPYVTSRRDVTLELMAEITIRKRSHTDAIQTQRKFFKKTAKGKVLKGLLLRDPYIPCSWSEVFSLPNSSYKRTLPPGRCAMWTVSLQHLWLRA